MNSCHVKVEMAEGYTYARKIGTVRIAILTDIHSEVLELQDVLYLPDLSINLISIRRMIRDHGLCVYFMHRGSELYRNEKYLGLITEDANHNLECPAGPLANAYYANLKLNTTKRGASLRRWHRRLCHLGINNIRKLAQQVEGLIITDDSDGEEDQPSKCEACAMGKAHKDVRNILKAKQNKTPKRNSQKVEELADRIHTDLGEMQSGIGNYQYFLLLVDEHTRYIWSYPMVKKSEVQQIYTRFEAMLKTQFGRTIKSLRSDNAGEIISNKFQDHIEDTGTFFEVSIAYAHEQNGLAERHIRTIKERIFSVLADSKLPYRLWPEILKTVVWFKNRSPARILKNKTPYEALYKHKLDLSDLKILGCKAYALIPPEKRQKADFKSSACRYLGPEATNQHRLYEEASGRVIYARDVVFDEDAIIESIPDVQYQGAAQGISSAPHTVMPPSGTVSYEQPVQTQANNSLGGEIVDTTLNNEPPARVVEEPETTPSQETSPNLRRSERIRMPSKKLRETLEQLQSFSEPSKHAQIFRALLGPARFYEPRTYQEALASEESKEWLASMTEEYSSLKETIRGLRLK
jgi:hypothetical protein